MHRLIFHTADFAAMNESLIKIFRLIANYIITTVSGDFGDAYRPMYVLQVNTGSAVLFTSDLLHRYLPSCCNTDRSVADNSDDNFPYSRHYDPATV